MMDMNKEFNRLERLKRGFEQLRARAMEDGIITEEESAILEAVETNLTKYEKLIEDAAEDGIITQEEKNQLIDFEEKIMSDAYFVADEDDRVSPDEAELIKLLIKVIDEKASVDWLDEDIQPK